ncbi:synaptonemal complex protein 1-like [Liolophura sinensis]|uniref:synaptonemal complex protein 1-like n=1 Tax=Liolophura sinensis TaxID=3198878 RepID=UPI003158A71F
MRREEFDRKLKDLNNLQEKGEESVKDMEQRLALKSKSATDFETKVKSLKTDATVKNKQIKELEKETKSLKSQLDKMTKAQNCLKTNLEEKDSEIKSATANQLDLEKQLEILKKKIEEDKEFVQHSKEQVSKMEQEKKKAMEEKESAAKKCEYEMGEMMSTLEKYKQDNQNILTQKDKEIGVLKSKVAELRKQADDKTEDLRSELDSLKKKLDEEEKEKSVMEKRAAKQEKKMTAVVKQSNSKFHFRIFLEKQIFRHCPCHLWLCHVNTSVEPALSDYIVFCVGQDDEIQSLKKSLEELKEQLVKEKTVVVTPQQRYPEEPIQNLEALITPRVPKASSLEVLKTAQRSILRQTAGSSVSKKRRVAFSTDLDSHGENSDSSSSELMEVEISEVENRYKDKKKRRNTPIPVRPSPKVSKSPGPDGDCGKESVMMTPLRPVPRGPSINSKKKKTSNLTDEMGQFKRLFPNFVQSDEKQQSKSREPDVSSNVRKTPSKASGKFFKSSPKDRNRFSKLSKLEEKEDLAWFDLDSVFGFGPED